jgi:hypothetical protein
MEGEQHNTTDIAYFGPNPLMTFLYLAALRAGAAIARELGDGTTAEGYLRLAEAGARRTDELLWNGEFYQQRLDLAPGGSEAAAGRGHGGAGDATAAGEVARMVARGTRDPVGQPYNQVHDGCLTDQLLGQWMTNLVGLGKLADPERIRGALAAVVRHNFRRMTEVPTNFMRAFALNDERGVLFASFPRTRGELIPLNAVFRAHEVWSGCEYALAALLIQEGLVDEGAEIVAAIRARHDGATRNPWNEPECGDHYARALASYGLLQAYAGLQIDLSRGRVALAPPPAPRPWSTFFAVEGAWGSLRVEEGSLEVEVGWGELRLRELVLDGRALALGGERVVTPGRVLSVAT